ncbi:MAG: histidine phosphatase family protein [Geitlerinemataceae cyanobacterium]
MQLKIDPPSLETYSSDRLEIDRLASPQTATKVILVRHGQSTYNKLKLYQGDSDDSILTEQGKCDASSTGIFLKKLLVDGIDAIYTSPLTRVQQTTREILSALKRPIPIAASDKLQEIHMSSWQGLSYKYVKTQFENDYSCWQERPHEFSFSTPKGKPYFPVVELFDRAREFWQEILPQHRGKTLLIVAHGGTNRALMATALGWTGDRYHLLQQSNCGVSILEFPPENRSPQLTALNLTAHLGETLPKAKGCKEGLRLLLLSAATPEAQVRQLAQHLQSQPIDFILSSDDSDRLADCLVRTQPTAVHLHVRRDDLPQAWQHTLRSRQNRPLGQFPLTTGLVVAREEIAQSLLSEAFNCSSLPLHPGTLSVIHYPANGRPPVLQALNFQLTQQP